jgi:hypothetical protein
MKGAKKTRISGLEFATVLAEQHTAMQGMMEVMREIISIVSDRPHLLTGEQKKRFNEMLTNVDEAMAKEQEWLGKNKGALMDILRSP